MTEAKPFKYLKQELLTPGLLEENSLLPNFKWLIIFI